MLASICITILVVPALLFMLLTVLITHGYTMAVPQGQNAMGLAFIFLALIAAAAALFLATLLSFAQGPPWWISPSAHASHLLAAAIAAGIGMASVGTLIAWMERWGPWVPPLAIITAIAGPIILSAVLMIGAWKPPAHPQTTSFHLALAPTLCLIALAGYVLCGRALVDVWKNAQANRERVAAAQDREAQEKLRRQALSPVRALEEDFAIMSPQAPLWVFVARLPDEPDPMLRALIIKRALDVPDFDAQLAATLSDDHPRYRHGTLALMLALPPEDLKPQWITPLKQAIDTTTSQIRARPAWLTPDSFSNPKPTEHVVAMVQATAALHANQQLCESLDLLRSAISSIRNEVHAADCLNAFDQARLTTK